MSFLELRFLGKMALLALGGRPQPLKKPSQSRKGHFYVKMNALNDTKTPGTVKSLLSPLGNIRVVSWHLSKQGSELEKRGTFSILHEKGAHKNKACLRGSRCRC